jgi:hypothetical protein
MTPMREPSTSCDWQVLAGSVEVVEGGAGAGVERPHRAEDADRHGAAAVIEVRREGGVAHLGETQALVANVAVEAEDFEDDDDSRARLVSFGQGEDATHLAATGWDRDAADAGHPASSASMPGSIRHSPGMRSALGRAERRYRRRVRECREEAPSQSSWWSR